MKKETFSREEVYEILSNLSEKFEFAVGACTDMQIMGDLPQHFIEHVNKLCQKYETTNEQN